MTESKTRNKEMTELELGLIYYALFEIKKLLKTKKVKLPLKSDLPKAVDYALMVVKKVPAYQYKA